MELVESPYVSAVWCPCLTPIQHVGSTTAQLSVEHGFGDAVIAHPQKLSGPTKFRTLDVMFDAILCAVL